jgi:hypothetical protein
VSRRKFDFISVFMDLSIVFCDKLVVVIFYGFGAVIVKRFYDEVLINYSSGHFFCFPLFYSL